MIAVQEQICMAISDEDMNVDSSRSIFNPPTCLDQQSPDDEEPAGEEPVQGSPAVVSTK